MPASSRNDVPQNLGNEPGYSSAMLSATRRMPGPGLQTRWLMSDLVGVKLQ